MNNYRLFSDLGIILSLGIVSYHGARLCASRYWFLAGVLNVMFDKYIDSFSSVFKFIIFYLLVTRNTK